MDYAIIRLGNKQHRVRDGETLVVDRVQAEEGKSFEPDVLLGSGKVTATVLAHERGPKIRIGKYRRRTGYKRHNGYRSATSRVQISFGGGGARRAAASAPKQAPVQQSAAAEQPAAVEQPAGLPEGYDGMTIAGIKAGAEGWSRDEIEAALAYEHANAARKGAIAALAAALAKEEG
jgi:large subunit ribosomal protein L21